MTMKLFSRTTAAAFLAGSLGLASAIPATIAQETTAPAQTQAPALKGDAAKPGFQHQGQRFERHRQSERGDNNRGGAMMGRGILDLVCSERGAERLEHMFVSLDHRVGVTDTQRAAFDDLKSTALTAQTDFTDTCMAARDAIRADAQPDVIKTLQNRLAVDTARVDALGTVLPKFETFYKGLSEEQKASFVPRELAGMRDGRHHQRPGFGRPGTERPGQNVTPPASSAPADEANPDDAEG
jgi:hypothetical protein